MRSEESAFAIRILRIAHWKKWPWETRLIESRRAIVTVRMMGRVALVCAALLSILASAAFGAGEYQRTKDGKTLIWNADPKADDSASWWGERDKDGYAKGVGELTWYTGQGTVYARYYGNMVHGKLDGPVNVHVKGTTAHAFFSDGNRMTGWARGPASSRFATDWRSAIAREKTGAVPATSPPPSSEPVSASEELRRGAQETQESPAEGPAEEAARKKEESGKAKFAPAKLPARGEEAARKPEENVESPRSNIEQSRSKTAESENQRAEDKEQQPAQGATARQGNQSHPSSFIPPPSTPPQPTAAAAQDHASLTELAAPPAALRSEPVVETPSTAPEADLASSPSASAQLTTDEAVTIADTEASARGYDLSQYQRPTADYSKVKRKWSLVYDLKNPDTAEQSARHFRVTVDDASRKADVYP